MKLAWPKIYTPRPGGADSEEEDIYEDEVIQQDPPAWHRHFDKDELFGRCEPIRELGIALCIYINYSLYECGNMYDYRSWILWCCI